MIIESTSKLKELLLSKTHKICILDNNSVELLRKIENHAGVEVVFKGYDLVLVPEWIKAEIEDSEIRKNYVKQLSTLEEIYFCYISELDYLDLMNGRDADLFRLFYHSCSLIKPLESFIKKEIIKRRPIEDLEDYDVWLNLLYGNGFRGEILSNGRERKKNAGEISICVLSLILSYFYIDNVENITIFTNDSDTYNFSKYAISEMQQEKYYKNIIYKSITFMSNDLLIYNLYNKKLMKREILNNIHSIRNERWMRFARKKHDNSIEERYKLVQNEEFIQMMDDSSLYIIF